MVARPWRFREPIGPAERLADIDNVQAMAVDGDDFFFGASFASQGGIAKIALSDKILLNLARGPFLNLASIFVDGGDVYWIADDGSVTTSLMRSDREPGETTMLGSLAAPVRAVSGALQVIGDHIYFVTVAMSGGLRAPTQMYRMAKAGGDTPQAFGIANGISALLSDGVDLFALVGQVDDALGNPTGDHGIARVNLEDGALEMLYSGLTLWALTLDGDDFYWASSGMDGADTGVWRGNKRGEQQAVNLAHGWQFITGGVAHTASAIYWGIPCGTSMHADGSGAEISYLVRVAK